MAITSFDTFVGLPLDQSIASTAWDAGGISWQSYTLLAGNGSNAVKSTQDATNQGFANYTSLAGQIGQAVFFKIAPGRSTDNIALGLCIDAPAGNDQYNPPSGAKATVGSFGQIEIRDLAAGVSTFEVGAISDNTEYCLEITKTTNVSGLEYRVTLYAASGGVRGSPIATAVRSMATALPGTNKRVALSTYQTQHALLTINRVESVDGAAANAAPTAPGTIANITGTGGVAITPVDVHAAFSDTDTLTYSASPAGTAWPSGLVVNASTGIISGTVATSTTAGLKVRATDTAAQTVDSNAFTVTISASGAAAPNLSSPTATATGPTTATGTVATDKAGGVLRYLFSANATETAATLKASASQSVTATGTQTVNVSTLTPGATLYPHYLQTDAQGNDSAVVNGASFTLPTPDTVAPVFGNGAAITPGAITSSSLAGSYPAATDASNQVRYEYSTNSGAIWTANGTGTTFSIPNLTAGTTYPVWISALDPQNNRSTPLQTTMTTSAAATGSFTGDAWLTSAEDSVRANETFTGTWYSGGVVGSNGGTATLVSGTLSSGGVPNMTGLPKGPGMFLGKTGDGSIIYEEGTVV